jgi:IS5 family transposase
VIKQQFGFQNTRLRGLNENRYKINVLTALTNPYLTPGHLLAGT